MRRSLSGPQVVEIRTRAAAGETFVDLGREFKRHPTAIARICRGLRYIEVGGPRLPSSDEDIRVPRAAQDKRYYRRNRARILARKAAAYKAGIIRQAQKPNRGNLAWNLLQSKALWWKRMTFGLCHEETF